MDANNLCNITPRPCPQQLFVSLFYTAVTYAMGVSLVSLVLRSPKSGAFLFDFWGATTGSTSLFITLGFFTTSKQGLRVNRALLHLLLVVQILSGICFVPEVFWTRLREDILDQVSATISGVSIVITFTVVLPMFHYVIDCIYVYATARTTSNDEGFKIVTLLKKWLAYVTTSGPNNQGLPPPVASTETFPLQERANMGNLQARLLHMIQKKHLHQLPPQNDPAKDRLLDDIEIV